MKQRINNWAKLLYGFLMTILGFSGCDHFENTMEEYGQPYAEFKLVGEVKSEEGKPIKGIRVIVKPYIAHTEQQYLDWNRDTLYTDADGKFSKESLKHTWPNEMKGSTIIFEDIDGPENGGEFESKTLTDKEFTVEQMKKGDGNWYDGDFLVTANTTLSPKKQD